MNIAIASMNKYIDKNYVSWQEPNGGYLIWVKFNKFKSINLDDILKKHGIKASIGNNNFFNGTEDTYIRLSISSLSGDEIEEGIRRLGGYN